MYEPYNYNQHILRTNVDRPHFVRQLAKTVRSTEPHHLDLGRVELSCKRILSAPPPTTNNPMRDTRQFGVEPGRQIIHKNIFWTMLIENNHYFLDVVAENSWSKDRSLWKFSGTPHDARVGSDTDLRFGYWWSDGLFLKISFVYYVLSKIKISNIKNVLYCCNVVLCAGRKIRIKTFS